MLKEKSKMAGRSKRRRLQADDYSHIVNGLNKARVEKIFGNFSKCRILIVGDIMLDRYLWGNCSRISPEAPVPVVEIEKEEHLLGGAANVANNIAALKGQVELLGVVGKDIFARDLEKQLKARGFSTKGIFKDSQRPTTVKTRVIAQNQQIVRADRENTREISKRLNEKIFDYIESILDKISGVIISDYGKGVISAGLLDRLIASCLKREIFIAVDPKQTHFFNYRRVTTITPNNHEAGFAVGRKITDDISLREVGAEILKRLESESVLITLGPQGMALFEKAAEEKSGYSLTRIPTLARKVFDVTGAGDTVISTMAIAAAAGASLKEAAFIANVAAGEVVAYVGTAQVERDRLKELVLGYIK